MKTSRMILLAVLITAVAGFLYFDLAYYLSFDFIKEKQTLFQNYYAEKPLLTVLLFTGVYILATALSLPGAAILTLLAGALFGVVTGTLIVSFASTIGASLAFLSARIILRDAVQSKFANWLKPVNEGIEKEGAFYLFTLRLVPVVPFFAVNLLMALTPIKLWTYFWVSQLGMFLGTVVYVNAGTQIAQIESLKDIVSPTLLMSFVLLGIFPLLAKSLLNLLQKRKVYKGHNKPKSFDADIVVLGAGAAGLVSSLITSTVKAKAILIESEKMGGDCLNTGCVPSKAIIRSAKMAEYIRRSDEFGVGNGDNLNVDFPKVMARVRKAIAAIEPHDSIERYTSLGVECITGYGKIISPWEVEVNGKVVSARNIIVATGGRPRVPKVTGVDEVGYLTSDTIWNLTSLPKRLLVLGGGPIGSELAQAFSRLGSEVTQLERNVRILAREDEDVSKAVSDRFTEGGIQLKTGYEALAFDSNAQGEKVLHCRCFETGQEETVVFDEVLIAVGREARVSGFGLEELGVEVNDNGILKVNDYLQTNFPNIYACGDVAGPFQFTHVASHQAWYASVNALFGSFKKFKTDYSVIPRATFIEPEVARVGLSELEAQAAGKVEGVDYDVTRFGIDDLDRAIADGEDYGFIKVLTQTGKDRILGVTIVGYHAAEILPEYVLAMKHGLGLNKILGTIHAYPTLSETNKFVAGEWKKARKPEKLLSYLERYFTWLRS